MARTTAAIKKVWQPLEGRLWAQVLTGLFLGAFFGILAGPDLLWLMPEAAKNLANWLAMPGHFFLAVIQMIVIPLVLSSVIGGICSGGNVENIKSLSTKIVLYFLMTTTVAVLIGGLLVKTFDVGNNLDPSIISESLAESPKARINEVLLDDSNVPKRIVGIIPRNPFNSFSSGEMLQIVLFAAVLGAALLVMPAARSKPLLDMMSSTQEACMVVVGWILRLAPLAVFGLIFELTAKLGVQALESMAGYMLIVITGLLAMVCFYTFLLMTVAKRNPLTFFKQIREAQLIAFSTSSSSATMPVTLRVAEEHLNIPQPVARFVIPLGTTINMDGTALYQTVAAVFLAQAFQVPIGPTEMIAILVTAIAASIGTPGTPGVGIVVLASILVTVGVPAEGIAIIIGVDRILDMCRTTVNVTGDLVACTVMEKIGSKKGFFKK